MPIFTFLIAGLQTLLMILPGFILMEEGVKFSLGLTLMLAYFLISEFFQTLIRTNYHQHNLISLPVYIAKIALSLILIWFISTELSYQHGIILIAFEVFQFLVYSQRYNYFDRLSYSLTNAFFKGFIFNLLISLKMPQTVSLINLAPYVFSFTLILCLTFLIQAYDANQARRQQQLTFAFLSSIIVSGQLLWLAYQKSLSPPLLALMIVLLIASMLFYVWEHPTFKAELVLNLGGISLLVIYYLYLN